ncbi:MAG: hypothetical protein IKS41_00985 [Alphaproteobacteria bacterium]|nr:hypothetical protein [Alphaproteobacteria bacterium]
MPQGKHSYTGYFGEEICVLSERKNADGKVIITGWGTCVSPFIDPADAYKDFRVEFMVSEITGKKDGYYRIFPRSGNCEDFPIKMECSYKENLLHGEESWYSSYGDILSKRYWLRGKEVEPFETREKSALKAKEIRKLFSNPSLFEGVDSPRVVAIKSGFTRKTIDDSLCSRQR